MSETVALAFSRAPVITVSELTRAARLLIERQLPLTWVAGELSNFRRYDSGHCYFLLKDAQAQLRCVMFRSRAQHLDWKPADGQHVEVRAAATLYEARGEFQLTVDAMRVAGSGALYEAFSRLKARLEAEGLFGAERKRTLPRFPQRIGIVTSLQAAALRDVLTTLARRWPGMPVVIYPTSVQGAAAAAGIAAAIEAAGRRAECDVLIVCRGGGSIEDLWSFNEEIVARAIVACSVPVVSGVGHETDFTIADFVADVRAPTPTGAAELVSPDAARLAQDIAQSAAALARAARLLLERRLQDVDYLSRRLLHPGERLDERRRHLVHLRARLTAALTRELGAWRLRARGLAHEWRLHRPAIPALREQQRALAERARRALRARMAQEQNRLDSLAARLTHLDPRQVLARGYAVVRAADGTVVRDARRLAAGDHVDVHVAVGAFGASVDARRASDGADWDSERDRSGET